MIRPLIFTLLLLLSTSEKTPTLSLLRTPLNTSMGLNISMPNSLFLEFRLDNKGIELYPTNDCPLGSCPICPLHYILEENETFQCSTKVLKLQEKSLKVPKKNNIKFINNATKKLRIFDGFFGMGFVKRLMKTNNVKPNTLLLNGTKIIFGRQLNKPEIVVNYNKDYSFNSTKFQVGGRFIVDSLIKIHLKSDKKGIALPEHLFKKVRTFLHFSKVKCQISKNNSLKCRYPKSQQRFSNAFIEFSLENDQKIKIKLINLLRNCEKKLCESLIFVHKNETVQLMGSLLSESIVEFDFSDETLAFKSLNKTMFFEQTPLENNTDNKLWIKGKKNFLKVLFILAIIIVSLLIGRKLFKCLFAKIEKSLPNYKKAATSEETEGTAVNSFRTISREIQNARKSAVGHTRMPPPIDKNSNKPRVKKTIFG